MVKKIFPLLLCCVVCVPVIQLAYCSPHNNKKISLTSDKIEVVDVIIKNYSNDYFKRIGEYFNGGKEYRGHRCIIRDDESVREGLYFIANFSKSLNKLPGDLTINVYIMAERSLDYKNFTFELPNVRPSLGSEVYLGITSEHLDSVKINAWKIELVDSQKNLLACNKSYMWPKNL